jgi:hypothetical protein
MIGQSKVEVEGAIAKWLETHSFCSTQINLPEPLHSDVLAFPINEDDIVERELNPHVTVRYGLTDVTAANVARVLSGVGPVRVVLGLVSVFEAEPVAAQGRWASFTDRYQSLNIPYPNPKTVCQGQCEGTGWVPVYIGCDYQGETDLQLIEAWHDAEDENPTDDGWHFVRCPACGGTGLRGLLRRMLSSNQLQSEEFIRARMKSNTYHQDVSRQLSDGESDVLKIDVHSEDLHRLNTLLKSLPYTDTHPTYQPHVTLAYVKPGRGKYYEGISTFVGREFTVDSLVFTDRDEKEMVIRLMPEMLAEFDESKHPRDKKGEFGSGGQSKSERAIANYKPSTRAKQVEAAKSEVTVAKALNGSHLLDNEPMDVIMSVGRMTHGIEVKTLLDNKNDKITMHPESRMRKEDWVKTSKARGHTVIVDKRNRPTTYYYHSGFGAFRLAGMTKTSLSNLRGLIR